MSGLSFDHNYGGRYNDFFQPAGFAFLEGKSVQKIVFAEFLFVWVNRVHCFLALSSKMGFTNSYDLRLAILAVLRLQPCSLVILAPVCSGFSYMCSSQAKRFWFDPLGDETYEWVKCGNLMANRVILLCWLCSALGHVWLVEQPSSAKFGDLPRRRFFCEQVVYAIWMALAIYLGGTLHLYLFGFLFAVFAVFAENMYLLT